MGFGMRRLGSVTLCCAALAACALGPSRRQVLSQYVGASETALVQALGVPTRTYETGGIKFLAYEDRSVDVVPQPAPYPFGPYGGLGYGYGYGAFPPAALERTCDTTFQIVAGVVRSFTLRGNAC